MWNHWLLSDWDPYRDYSLMFPSDTHRLYSFGGQLWSRIGAFVDTSLFHPGCFHAPGSLAIGEAFGRISHLAGALLLLLSRPNSALHRNVLNDQHRSCKSHQSCAETRPLTTCGHDISRFPTNLTPTSRPTLLYINKVADAAAKLLRGELHQFQQFSWLSIAASLVPSVENLSSRILVAPLDGTIERMKTEADLTPCAEENNGCHNLPLLSKSWMSVGDTTEPQTGIKFPIVLDKHFADGSNSNKISKVLVGVGSRSMKVIKVKKLKVYAFGLYVHPGSVCKKLGQKYACVPVDELKGHEEFLQDLLRADIDMTVRLVVSCNYLKMSTVQTVFERSLRNRLLKMNPDADVDCLRLFGSQFPRDIQLSTGTTIDFRQTTDGQLITEFGGKQIGAVQSKDLCRAFFSMYIGDIPVSVQAKKEIGENVADIIKRC
ncbi:fatty-acid-binding protein 2 [Nymphaea colorata]|nr:fatty-acid-binding protein 2 [Nymphaea colorata]